MTIQQTAPLQQTDRVSRTPVAIKDQIDRDLVGLRTLVPIHDEGEDEEWDAQVASWPVLTTALLELILRLRRLNPLAAFLRLAKLELVVSDLVDVGFGVDPVLALRTELEGHYPAFFKAAFAGDRAGLIGRVAAVAVDEQLSFLDLPPDTMVALGRRGREQLILRLVNHQLRLEAAPGDRITEVLLSDPDTRYVIRTIGRHGLQAIVTPGPMLERLLAEEQPTPDILPWFKRALEALGHDVHEHSPGACAKRDALTHRCATICMAAGLPELAQAIRWHAFLDAFTPRHLRNWLQHVPPGQRAAEEASTLQRIIRDERWAEALRFLLEWPDLVGAAQLVRCFHEDIDRVTRSKLTSWAELLEDTAPDAALLLHRLAVQVFDRTVWEDDGDRTPQIRACAALWKQHPGILPESHEAFLTRYGRERLSLPQVARD